MRASNMHTSFDTCPSIIGQVLCFIVLCLLCAYVLFFDLYLMVAVWYGTKASSLIFADESDPCSTATEWLFWNGILAFIVLLIDCFKAKERKPVSTTQTQGYASMDQNGGSAKGDCLLALFLLLWTVWLCKGPARLKAMDNATDDDECGDVHNWATAAIIGGFCALGLQALGVLCAFWIAICR
jgi:hypothetical protein